MDPGPAPGPRGPAEPCRARLGIIPGRGPEWIPGPARPFSRAGRRAAGPGTVPGPGPAWNPQLPPNLDPKPAENDLSGGISVGQRANRHAWRTRPETRLGAGSVPAPSQRRRAERTQRAEELLKRREELENELAREFQDCTTTSPTILCLKTGNWKIRKRAGDVVAKKQEIPQNLFDAFPQGSRGPFP